MESMLSIAQTAMQHMPPERRFRPEDGPVIHRHQEALLALEPELVAGFYDTLFAHEPTAGVFGPTERPDREQTLSHWWRSTVEGPIDDRYFSWMAMVGLVHVVRGVSNPMMLAMTDYVAGFVADRAVPDLDAEEGQQLVDAFHRLAATVGAIIAYGYDQAVAAALYNVAGMPEALLTRLRNQEVATALTEARSEVGA